MARGAELPAARRLPFTGRDAVAGVTVAAVAVPSVLAYAELAGLPPVTGLYATIVPLLAFALLGSSPQLIVGPDASASALVAAAVLPLAAVGTDRYTDLAALLALVAGAVLVGGGLARLGFLADLLSQPVLVGYLAGLALTVIAGQLEKLLGIDVGAGDPIPQVVESVREVGETSGPTLALGASCLVVILVLRRWRPRVPGTLLAVVVAAVAAWALDLGDEGVALVGTVPPGLPAPELPALAWGDLRALLGPAVGIALVAFADSTLTSRSFATRRGDRIDASRDMLGLGAANAAAALFQGFPISSSGARTAVSDSTGGHSRFVGVVAAAAMALVLVFLTGPLQYLPIPALGAVLVAAVLPLVDVPAFRRLWAVRRLEFALASLTVVGVLVLGLLEGVVVAVVLSVVELLARLANPHDALLEDVAALGEFVDYDDGGPVAQAAPGLAVYRFDAPLFFANAERFANRVRLIAAEPGLEWLLLDLESTPTIDASAADALAGLLDELGAAGPAIALARLSHPVHDVLARSGVLGRLAGHVYPTIGDAIDAFRASRPGPGS